MLGLFFLLVWISVIAALTSTERRRARARLLLPGQVDDEFRTALQAGDHGALVRYYRLALSRELPPRDEQLIRINLACALNGLKQYQSAMDELDKVQLAHLSPTQVALWLNNRAYTLTLLGQATDALDNLRDAEELLAGDDGLSKDPSLTACIAGTRGIALYHQGDYERAESALQLALSLEDDGVRSQFELAAESDPARTASRKRAEASIGPMVWELDGPTPTASFDRQRGIRTQLFRLYGGGDAESIMAWLSANKAWQCLRVPPPLDKERCVRAVLVASEWHCGEGSALFKFARDRVIADDADRLRLQREVRLLIQCVIENPVKDGELQDLQAVEDVVNVAPLGVEVASTAEVVNAYFGA